ncbi:MAG: hypothetical protein IPM55_13275 [Acidobacteria bacterium]|nr:hypothetical protein [Acidobacteriota bacterium]
MNHSKSTTLILGLLILTGLESAMAQSGGSVSDLGWMAGTWTCEKWGGEMKEIWAAPSGNTMIGMFSHVKAGEPGFYEFYDHRKEPRRIEVLPASFRSEIDH